MLNGTESVGDFERDGGAVVWPQVKTGLGDKSADEVAAHIAAMEVAIEL